MVIRERRGTGARAALAYALRGAQRPDESASAWLLNAGVSAVTRSVPATVATRCVEAVAASRPDLRSTTLHLTLSPAPTVVEALSEGELQTRLLDGLAQALRAISASDRVALATLHPAPHPGGVPHLHAVIALPSPETGQSIPQHRLRDRLRDAAIAIGVDLAAAATAADRRRREEEESRRETERNREAPPPPFPPAPSPRKRRRDHTRGGLEL